MKKSSDKVNMLEGSIWKALLIFFFPILLGTFFQQLYNTVDAAIVGHFANENALSCVGGSSAIIINLVVGFFMGLSAGCTVLISQFYGAGDRKRLTDALHTSYAFGICGGIILGILGIILAPNVLRLMNTPEELMDLSALYLRIYFAGLEFVFIYNMGAAILRALGDSKRPLYYLIACTIINIILDLILVVAFHLDVLGVALATTISQGVSAFLVTYCLMRKSDIVKLEIRNIRFHSAIFSQMIKIGLPSGIQSSTYSLSNMVIQAAINLFGTVAIEGWTATGKVDVIFWMINGSFGIAAATFVGQNYGAKNLKRINKGVRTCMGMALGTAVVVSVLLMTCGKYMLWLFTTKADVISMGKHMIELIVPGYFLFVFIEIFSATLRAEGKTVIPTIINISGIVIFRCVWILVFARGRSLDFAIYCYPLSWLICAVLIAIYYFVERRKLNKYGFS